MHHVLVAFAAAYEAALAVVDQHHGWAGVQVVVAGH